MSYYYEDKIGIDTDKYYWNAVNPDNRQNEWKEEREKYGFDERETWGLDCTFMHWIYPRLKYFREVHSGHPSYLSEYEWNKVLDEMIEGIEIYLKSENDSDAKVNKSIELFKECLFDLWW